MKPNEIVEDFTKQRDAALDKIKKLEVELNTQKELFLKLQGALEGIALYSGGDIGTTEEVEVPETAEAEPVS
tara:strand:+ start:1195 stop:1410 length:216 start_codon:yes stop_codon:yes gene_type:complete